MVKFMILVRNLNCMDSNADYADGTKTRRSSSGFIFMMTIGIVAYSQKLLSTTEAKCVVVSRSVQELILVDVIYK